MHKEVSDTLAPEAPADLRERNEARAKEAIERLGRKYLCHPANAPKRVAREVASTVLSRYWGSA